MCLRISLIFSIKSILPIKGLNIEHVMCRVTENTYCGHIYFCVRQMFAIFVREFLIAKFNTVKFCLEFKIMKQLSTSF